MKRVSSHSLSADFHTAHSYRNSNFGIQRKKYKKTSLYSKVRIRQSRRSFPVWGIPWVGYKKNKDITSFFFCYRLFVFVSLPKFVRPFFEKFVFDFWWAFYFSCPTCFCKGSGFCLYDLRKSATAYTLQSAATFRKVGEPVADMPFRRERVLFV